MSKKRDSSIKETWLKVRRRKTKVKKSTYLYWVDDCGVVDGKRFIHEISVHQAKDWLESFQTHTRFQRLLHAKPSRLL